MRTSLSRALSHQQARAEEEKYSHSREAAAQKQADRIVNRACLDRDRSLRSETDELYQKSLQSATTALASLRRTPEYEGILRTLIEEAYHAAGDATALHVDPDDEALAHRIVAADDRPTLDVIADLRSGGGVELVGTDGWRVLNTFESRLERAEAYLRKLFRDKVIAGSSP